MILTSITRTLMITTITTTGSTITIILAIRLTTVSVTWTPIRTLTITITQLHRMTIQTECETDRPTVRELTKWQLASRTQLAFVYTRLIWCCCFFNSYISFSLFYDALISISSHHSVIFTSLYFVLLSLSLSFLKREYPRVGWVTSWSFPEMGRTIVIKLFLLYFDFNSNYKCRPISEPKSLTRVFMKYSCIYVFIKSLHYKK